MVYRSLMGRAGKIILVVTAAIPLLGLLKRPPEFTLLIYTVFAVAWLRRKTFKTGVAKISGKPWFKLWVCMVAAGLLAEVLAWGGHYLARTPEPALLHPQLIPDLIIAVGFYSGWVVAWLIVLRRWAFTLAEAFIVAGALGVCCEQNGEVLLRVGLLFLANPVWAVMSGVFVFAVYGSIVGLGYMPVVGKFDAPKTKRDWIKYPAAFALMFVGMQIGLRLAALVGLVFHVIPEKQPIGTHPFF